MAGVFGTAITEATVRATGEYGGTITQNDCADYALKMMNAGGKDTDVVKYLENLKDQYGNGIAAKCLIYNATGTTLTLTDTADWAGFSYNKPPPPVIQNGQWGGFLYVHPTGQLVGSWGAVVYQSRSPACDLLFCWGIPYVGANHVYTEIREQGHFPQYWSYIENTKLSNAGKHTTDKAYGYYSDTAICEGTTVEARAIFQNPYPNSN